MPLVDERKANRICAERFATLRLGCTIDVFSHPKVHENLGQKALADAVFNALYHGRMRILAHHAEWVIGLIGTDRAALCVSLPRSARPPLPKTIGER